MSSVDYDIYQQKHAKLLMFGDICYINNLLLKLENQIIMKNYKQKPTPNYIN